MKFKFTLTIAAILALTLMMLGPAMIAAEQDSGTRAGEIGWQYDTFQQNIEVTVEPEEITTMDQIVVTISSVIPEVGIKQALLGGVVYPDDGFQFPISFSFFEGLFKLNISKVVIDKSLQLLPIVIISVY